ncbi:hypothetical protein AGABI1DRAFT_116012 [Agaricus bisporus var. burnettii JB137-S8]|uniref:Hydrophobin n=1 Tax=Agaricus bisporus var. burnettii (strain JB137-S8 / ATCC MYA-4627 / FGSC 10392) TaxID=597362 RepID=K5WZ57_AGABU|nr:uncharacterized protein AGABI1DRAFT_116012 [Agaricus bisporus var. burnettii JB137-S8]EKM76088.1 hypothetical protein AGABI1DRAFT_116012 [Agaricus bisporus var. burnettii JB137-S8]
MKFTLAILPAFFALSAFGNPVELDARQMPMCDVAKCISTIGSQPGAIIAPCADAAGNLAKIQQAQAQGMQPVKLISSALSPTQSNVFPPALRPASPFRPAVMVALVPHPVDQRPVSQHPVSPASRLK